MEICQFKVYIQKDSLFVPNIDKICSYFDNMENNDQVIMPGFETGTSWVIGRHDKDNNKKSRKDQVNIFLIML